MAKISKPSEDEKQQPERDPLVLTVSEHAKLSDEEKQAFRSSYGTVTSDPS